MALIILSTLSPSSLRFPIVALAALVADDADARAASPTGYGGDCPYGDAGYDPAPTGGYDYCAGQEILVDLEPRNADAIPIDGVLVLQAVSSGAWIPENVLPKIAATVTLDGNPVAGTLGVVGLQTLLWRPTDPFTAGATYHFDATITNPTAPGECAPPEYPVAFDFTADDQPATALVAPTLGGTAMLIDSPLISLETLACCPDVSPTLNSGSCGGAILDFDPEQCTPIVADGILFADLTGTPAATGPTAGQVHYTLTVDGNPMFSGFPEPHFTAYIDKPFCAIVTATDYASGTSVQSPMACFGTDVADQLGPHAIDPPAEFTCSLRQCEPTADAWDLEHCTPLDPNHPGEPDPEDDGEKGCGCTTTDASGAALLLGLVGLLAARRRR